MVDKKVHLLGHALNELLERGLVNLNELDDTNGSIECELLGKSSVINWHGIGHGEIRLSVWWDYDKTKHPQHLEGRYKNKSVNPDSNHVEKYTTSTPLAKPAKYKEFVGVVCSTWIERKEGKYLQTRDGKGSDSTFDNYIRQSTRPELQDIPNCSPNGFELTGRFHM